MLLENTCCHEQPNGQFWVWFFVSRSSRSVPVAVASRRGETVIMALKVSWRRRGERNDAGCETDLLNFVVWETTCYPLLSHGFVSFSLSLIIASFSHCFLSLSLSLFRSLLIHFVYRMDASSCSFPPPPTPTHPMQEYKPNKMGAQCMIGLPFPPLPPTQSIRSLLSPSLPVSKAPPVSPWHATTD